MPPETTPDLGDLQRRLEALHGDSDRVHLRDVASVRRRGQQRTRRAVAGATAGALAVTGTIAFATLRGVAPTEVPPASQTPTGSVSPTPSTAPSVIDASLFVSTDALPQVQGGWSEGTTSSGEGSPLYRCQSQQLTALGATETLRRQFEPGAGTVTAAEVVGVFPSAAAAGAALDELSATLASCPDSDLADPAPERVDEVRRDGAGAERVVMLDAQTRFDDGAVTIESVVLAQAADKVAVLAYTLPFGPDEPGEGLSPEDAETLTTGVLQALTGAEPEGAVSEEVLLRPADLPDDTPDAPFTEVPAGSASRGTEVLDGEGWCESSAPGQQAAQRLSRQFQGGLEATLTEVVARYPSAELATGAYEVLRDECAAAGVEPRDGTLSEASGEYRTFVVGSSEAAEQEFVGWTMAAALVGDTVVLVGMDGNAQAEEVGDGGRFERTVLPAIGTAADRVAGG